MPPDWLEDIGSEFHWDATVLTGGRPGAGLPADHELYATACGAMSAVLRHLAPSGRLHVPSYFCVGVAGALSAQLPIAWYRHLPDGLGPHWETLRPANGDVVIAQNLFGSETGERWRDWIAAHPGVTVLEDHSHDPLSEWARTSTAPYAVASLRKTLPLPDGGLLWSPRGLDLPAPHGEASPGSHLKLAGMLLKAAWLDGRPVPKAEFRDLQRAGEQLLLGSSGPAAPLTVAALPLLDVAGVRAVSIRRARELIASLPSATPLWRVLPAGPAPFRVQLLCPSEPVRDALLGHLARHRIYAPVHWRQDRSGWWSGDEQAAARAERMLTIPVDHRCGPADVRRIAGVLIGFTGTAGSALPVSRVSAFRTASRRSADR
ncbi:MAG: hypothetical protein ABW022_05420 [Actinoplanes sp.]